MRVAVVGAGIVGVCTAWELAADGHEVVVFERRNTVAEEGSFANAGVVAPGYVTPWAAPGMPAKVLAQLWSSHSAVRFGPNSWRFLPWMWKFLRACRPAVHEARKSAMRELALYSRGRLQRLADELDIAFEQSQGYLVLARSKAEWQRITQAAHGLAALNIKVQTLDAQGCRQAEPALRHDTPLAGGVWLESDFVGNCRAFAQGLKARAADLGVRFQFGVQVLSVQPGHPARLHWSTPAPSALQAEASEPGRPMQSSEHDAVVLCAGESAAALLRPLGLKLPLMPVYGCSLTAPLRNDASALQWAPRSGIMDERYKVAITRLGQHVRVAGSAEIGGHPAKLNASAQRTLYKVLEDWFPGACEISRARHWKGARPMMADGPPIVGPGGMPGLWLNLGHGSSGWALACGSARVLCDRLAQRSPAVDVAQLSLERFATRAA